MNILNQAKYKNGLDPFLSRDKFPNVMWSQSLSYVPFNLFSALISCIEFIQLYHLSVHLL